MKNYKQIAHNLQIDQAMPVTCLRRLNTNAVGLRFHWDSLYLNVKNQNLSGEWFHETHLWASGKCCVSLESESHLLVTVMVEPIPIMDKEQTFSPPSFSNLVILGFSCELREREGFHRDWHCWLDWWLGILSPF